MLIAINNIATMQRRSRFFSAVKFDPIYPHLIFQTCFKLHARRGTHCQHPCPVQPVIIQVIFSDL